MKLKKRVIPIFAGLLAAAVAVTSTASAHPYDFWVGKYIGKDNAKILLRITKSAQTDLFNWTDVYKYGYDWNNISKNVEVSLAYETTGMPTLADQMLVVGGHLDDNYLGYTYAYNSNGELMDNEKGYKQDWISVKIKINTDPNLYNNAVDKTKAARKTFVHEVGHALKLCHPAEDSSLLTHTYEGGKPFAIMNEGYPYPTHSYTSSTISNHDKACLIKKWGA